MSWLPKPYRHVEAQPGRLAVGGLVEIPFRGLSFDDLCALPAEFQVRNVGAFCAAARVPGAPIQGVRLKALLQKARAEPGPVLVELRGRGGFLAIVWRQEIEPLAIVAYARDGAPLPPELGGPFRLLLPGFHDEARDVWDLAAVEVTNHSNPKARNRRGLAPAAPSQPGEVQGGLTRSALDPADVRTIIVPPPAG
jgi:DMSO/TMAO reductase YedYZ molybdopterin-dependent catalytic subunit